MKLFKRNILRITEEGNEFHCCNREVLKRYFLLLLWSIITLVFYFQYDIPGSLQNNITHKYDITDLQFSYLYSVYSWPNIIMCLIGGFLMDRVFGPKFALIIYTSISAIGTVLVVVGGCTDNFILMLVGRFILGIGCESCVVAINSNAVLWFNGKELNMVFAILMNIGRIGSSVVFESSEPAMISFVKSGVEKDKVLGLSLIALGSVVFIALAASIICVFFNPPKEDKEHRETSLEASNPPAVKLSDVLKFPLQFWLLSLIANVYMGSIYSFFGLSQKSLTSKFNISDATANRYISFASFLGATLSPILGIFIDKYGRNLYYILVSIITSIITFSLLAFTFVNPYVGMFFMAVSMASMQCSVWALFSFIVPDNQIGTAYGVVQAVMNTLLSVGTVSAGAILTKYGSEMMETYLIILLVGTIPFILWTWVIDLRQKRLLNMSTKERNEYLENIKKSETELEAHSSKSK